MLGEGWCLELSCRIYSRELGACYLYALVFFLCYCMVGKIITEGTLFIGVCESWWFVTTVWQGLSFLACVFERHRRRAPYICNISSLFWHIVVIWTTMFRFVFVLTHAKRTRNVLILSSGTKLNNFVIHARRNS